MLLIEKKTVTGLFLCLISDKKIGTSFACSEMERKTRFELATFTLAR